MRCSINAGVTRSPSRVDHFFASSPHGRIGLDLLYADATHFTRAFPGWTGLPPTERRHLAAGLDTGSPMAR
ncbi:hypothetical protein [Methylobacterium sp. 10]|uniref:hypothetical protein n=1 Tax=Methylobacterium sp. 10 TaxID=1101191 RepID=UPI000483E562|nr:hypothetical protein [Methylobacterium sp. 10]